MNIISKQRSNYTIIEKIKRYIIDTNLEIGDKLPTEKELCNILNVSRSTLRESVKVLTYSGILKSVQGAGIYLISKAFDINNQDVNFLRLKVMIETEAIQETDLSNLEKDYWDVLQKLLIKREILLKSNDIVAYNKTDLQFHKKIVESSKNAYLIKWYEEISNDVVAYLNKLVIQDEGYSHDSDLHQVFHVSN